MGGINGRLERLERANREALAPPDFDYKAELIRRVNLVAERAEAQGEIPFIYEGGPAQVVEAFQEWVRRRYGNQN